MNRIIAFLRAWKLPVAMICGVVLFFSVSGIFCLLQAAIPSLKSEDISDMHDSVYGFITHIMQPVLLFSMLTLSFLKVRPQDLRPHRWHAVLLGVQALLFIISAVGAWAFASFPLIHLCFTGAMVCFICPTATAAVVIVQKLGGSISGIVTYIVLCNVMVSVIAPPFLTLVHPQEDMTFITEFFMIMGKVFPLLLIPLFVALIIRHYVPRLMQLMLSIPDMPFYLWLMALALAIMVTVRTISVSMVGADILICFAVVSMICCIVQFWLGRKIGRRWIEHSDILDEFGENVTKTSLSPTPDHTQQNDFTNADSAIRHDCDTTVMQQRSAVTAGQAFGQKNTIFTIWMSLVFLDPITSIVGGFYSIWHNVINSWQLKKRKAN